MEFAKLNQNKSNSQKTTLSKSTTTDYLSYLRKLLNVDINLTAHFKEFITQSFLVNFAKTNQEQKRISKIIHDRNMAAGCLSYFQNHLKRHMHLIEHYKETHNPTFSCKLCENKPRTEANFKNHS